MHLPPLRKLPVTLSILACLWLLLGGLVIPSLIRQAYLGNSWPVLNALIHGQSTHDVGFYLSKWNHLFWPSAFAAIAIASAMYWLPPHSLKPAALRASWNAYWFRETPILYLAIPRIVCVVAQLCLLLAVDAYNIDRIRELSALPDTLYDPLPILQLFTWPWGAHTRPATDIIILVFWITIAVGAFAAAGLLTNTSLLLFAAGSTFLQAYYYSFGDLHHPEALLILTLWLLAFSPSGRRLSLDALLVRKRTRTARMPFRLPTSAHAAWPLLLVQALFGIVYLDSAIRKLTTGGLQWMNGDTLQYYLFSDALLADNAFGIWLAHQHHLVWGLSILTILFEATFWTVILFPRAVWFYIPLGLGFHIGNSLAGVASFYHFMALYVVFLPQLTNVWTESPLARWLALSREHDSIHARDAAVPHPLPQHQQYVILFDGICSFCNRWVRFILRRDHSGLFCFAPLQSPTAERLLADNGLPPGSMDSIVLVTPTGCSVKSEAVLKIVSNLGGAWPAVIALRAIPRAVLDLMYDAFASRRYRWFGTTDSCTLPSEDVRARFTDIRSS